MGEEAKAKLQENLNKIWAYGSVWDPALIVVFMEVLEALANGHNDRETWETVARWTEGKE